MEDLRAKLISLDVHRNVRVSVGVIDFIPPIYISTDAAWTLCPSGVTLREFPTGDSSVSVDQRSLSRMASAPLMST